MLKTYLDLLTESLENKTGLLEQLLEQSRGQKALLDQALLGNRDFDMEAFDRLVDAKQESIDRILRMDSTFDSLYRKIEENLQKEKDLYKAEIAAIQDKIKIITDKSVEIQTLEARNKENMEQVFRKERQKYRLRKEGSKVAMNYYQNMRGVGNVSPQFMDRKK